MAADARVLRGDRNHRAGRLAEESALREYERAGHRLVAARWRGKRGEVDLILRDGPTLVFAEVKAGATHAAAAERIGPAQMRRIMGAAQEHVAGLPDGLATEMRFDAALVDGQGRVRIIRAAFGQD